MRRQLMILLIALVLAVIATTATLNIYRPKPPRSPYIIACCFTQKDWGWPMRVKEEVYNGADGQTTTRTNKGAIVKNFLIYFTVSELVLVLAVRLNSQPKQIS